MTNDEILDDAELFLARTSLRLIGPLPGECLVCYLARMLGEWGCRGPRFIDHYRDTVAPRATALRERLSRMGACCCDCEVFLNVYELRREPPPIGRIERIHMDFDEDLDPDEFGDERAVARGRKPYFLRIEPEVITGRRFVVGKAAVRRESLRPPARAGWWG